MNKSVKNHNLKKHILRSDTLYKVGDGRWHNFKFLKMHPQHNNENLVSFSPTMVKKNHFIKFNHFQSIKKSNQGQSILKSSHYVILYFFKPRFRERIWEPSINSTMYIYYLWIPGNILKSVLPKKNVMCPSKQITESLKKRCQSKHNSQ